MTGRHLQLVPPAGPARPCPAWMTIALDARGLHGPDVDRACGVQEPTVDRWESGDLVPTGEQLQALADLCRVPVDYFFQPPPEPSRAWLCDRTKRVHGLTVIDTAVDERGVLVTTVTTPPQGRPAPPREADVPRRTRRPSPLPTRAMRPHVPVDDPDAPGCCLTCRLPIRARNARHLDQPPETPPDAAALEARRLGETP